MKDLEIKQSPPPEEPPNEPVVPCLECGKYFVWWLHPIQLCDDCVTKNMKRRTSHEENA